MSRKRLVGIYLDAARSIEEGREICPGCVVSAGINDEPYDAYREAFNGECFYWVKPRTRRLRSANALALYFMAAMVQAGDEP